MISLTDYSGMWDSMAITDAALHDAASQGAMIVGELPRYHAVGDQLGIPAWWIGCIHMREASGDFTRHLHNGDPLTRKTVHVPAGRPLIGRPPFTWEASAADALVMRGLGAGDWSIPTALRKAEAYNGLGYRIRGLRSPYLWAGTTMQQPGKFVADSQWSATAWDEQPGVAALMQVIAGLGVDLAKQVTTKEPIR